MCYTNHMTIGRMGKLPENYDPREAEREDLAEMREEERAYMRKTRKKAWRKFLRFFR